MIDTVEREDTIISEEEAAQYDRQIRLWGLDAQKRLRGSKVLLVGLCGLGAEVAKNLILAGVTEECSRAQFLIPVGSEGQNRAQASLERAQYLNPMVEVKADTDNVCLTGCPRDLMVRVDQVCAQRNVKVFCGDVFGYHGYMFSDLGPEHHYVEEKPKVAKPSQEANDGPEAKKPKVDPNETTMVKKTANFCPLKEALEVDWTSEKAKASLKRTPADYFLLQVLLKFRTDKSRDPQPASFTEDAALLCQIRDDVLEALGLNNDLLPDDFVTYCFSEMAPVCAVVGGVLGQEIVKVRSPLPKHPFLSHALHGRPAPALFTV
ncbi:hypothetical protein JZ751_018856 [Albula glossodonta]|uniref:THIF-type NAD/FAD binding fold domain-containing protein n=1 Tax=Albula glossodonta TaxID=121402 RepID=A0A8T2MTW8_9TELE|nr:hypothetical protein JZ751_018856 [Albula glossodonta]